MDRHALQAVYVLHARRYGDSSLLVDLLTREQGRVTCVHKGALRPRRAAPPMQPFQRLLVQMHGRGEVLTVGHAEAAAPAVALSGRSLYCGLYINELVLKLTARHDPLPGLFDDYDLALRSLADVPAAEAVLRRFEVALLSHLGLGLQLQHDVNGRPLDPAGRYNYEIDSGPRPAVFDDAAEVSGSTLLALSLGEFDDATLREARLLMRRILHHHLDGRPLRSRELFR